MAASSSGSRRRLSRIVIPAGDPCGIGPEIILKALKTPPLRRLLRQAQVMVIGRSDVFARTARRLKQLLPRWTVFTAPTARVPEADLLFCEVETADSPTRFVPGKSDAAAGRAALAFLQAAVDMRKRWPYDTLVTAPVTKWAIEQIAPHFVGQTEFLAEAFGVRDVVMAFASDALRVVLVTRHVPLREVSARATPDVFRTTIRVTVEALRGQFGIRRPHLSFCGLNPHAGERGLFGDEEARVLMPVLNALDKRAVKWDGPHAADGLFARPSRADAIVCWYHDQALIPFKMAARGRGCQMTLGLPVIRTSPDHGSALDIAGRGIADAGAMAYALKTAILLASRRLVRAR